VITRSGQRKPPKDDPNASKPNKSRKKWCMHASCSVSCPLLAPCFGQSLCLHDL
jgi:hypothetical protein